MSYYNSLVTALTHNDEAKATTDYIVTALTSLASIEIICLANEILNRIFIALTINYMTFVHCK